MSIIGMRNKMSKYLKGLVIMIAVAFAVGFIGMTLGGNSGSGGRRAESGVLAKVNGEKLMWTDFATVLDRQTEQYREAGQFSQAMEIQIRGSIFDQMVDEMMKVQAAKEEGIKVSRRDLNKKIDEYVDMRMKMLREQALQGKKDKTDAVFEAALAKEEGGMTIEKKRRQLRKELAAYSEEIRRSLMIEHLNKKIEDSVKVTDQTLEESYDEARLSQITVGISGKRSDEAAKKRADEIAAKIKKGEDFAKLASQASDDMYKAGGGNRGLVRRAYIEPELKEVAFKLKAGEVSDPIKTEQGYVILKSEGVKRNLPSDFSDAKKKKEYKDQFAMQARQIASQAYYSKLQKQMKLEVMDPELKAYVAYKDMYQDMMGMSEKERKTAVEKVIKLYQEATVGAGASDDTGLQARCNIQIATLYGMLKGSPFFGLTEAEQEKYGKLMREALETALNYAEDNSLRMGLARMAIDAKDYDAAVENLKIASDNAYTESQTHEQIRDMYNEIKRPDLAAAEQKWIDDFNKQQMDSGTVTSGPMQIPAGGGE